MSKFIISNPAFLSAAGNVVFNNRIGTFYLQAIEDGTTVAFPIRDYTDISLDDVDYTPAPESVTLNSNQKVFIKIKTLTEIPEDSTAFNVNKAFNAGGICPFINIEINEGDDILSMTTYLPFYETKIKNAENLVIDISGIENLETLTSVVFSNCVELEFPPKLPALELTNECYHQMFYGCKKLMVPPELPATVLAESCYYQMFEGCVSLSSAPELPAVVLAKDCYQAMFYGCESITTSPVLRAEAIPVGAYRNMFGECASLSRVICLAKSIIDPESGTGSWLSGVSNTGVFVKAAEMNEWPTGVNGIPDGWTVQDYAG
jgi:hypothetical protein